MRVLGSASGVGWGLIEPLAPEERRIPYRLTEAGARHLGAQLSGLRRIAATGLRRLAAP